MLFFNNAFGLRVAKKTTRSSLLSSHRLALMYTSHNGSPQTLIWIACARSFAYLWLVFSSFTGLSFLDLFLSHFSSFSFFFFFFLLSAVLAGTWDFWGAGLLSLGGQVDYVP
jgi:hypothetical protein